MLKFQITFLIATTLVFLTISCNQTHKPKTVANNITTDSNYKVGDCFEFKEKITDFGVIFLEEKVYPDGKEFNLFPVKLDTTKKGLDKFKYGQAYITGFPDFTKSSGKTEGFMVYHFLYQKDFQIIDKYFTNVGHISVKDDYRNMTGGTMADNIDEFRFQLNMWDKMFGRDGKLVSVEEIMH